MMTGQQAKRALEKSTPYVSIGNLIALAALLVMGLQAGVIDVSAGDRAASQAEVVELSSDVFRNTSSIAELRRADERLDEAISSRQLTVTQRLQRVEDRVNEIYRLLIDRSNSPRGPP